MSRKDRILRNTKENLAMRKERKKLTTEQTQSSLNRVSRLPEGKQMREPQIGLKDGTSIPSLAPLTPHTPGSALTTRLRMAKSERSESSLWEPPFYGPPFF